MAQREASMAEPGPRVPAQRTEVGAERGLAIGQPAATQSGEGSAGEPAGSPADALAIAGMVKFSSVDWPGKLACVLFLQGCPLNCGYCQNPDLIDPRTPGAIAWTDVLAFLRQRRGLLDGVVFSGGEPTRQDLRAPIGEVRELGFAVGLHTAGGYPARLRKLLPLVDWVGLDIKALPGDYGRVAGVPAAGAKMAASLRAVLASGVDYQLRTTYGPAVLSDDEAREVQRWAMAQGGTEPVLQPVRTQGTRPDFQAAHEAALRASRG